MKKGLTGIIFALVAGFALGWLIKPQKEEHSSRDGQTLDSSIEDEHRALNGEVASSEIEVSNYIQKIEELEAQIGKLEPLRDYLEKQHQDQMRMTRKSHEEGINKIDSIVFLEPHQIASLRQIFQLREDILLIRRKKAIALLTEKEADDLLAALPSLQPTRKVLSEILSKDQMVLYQEAEYQEQRENRRRSAVTSVGRLTNSIDISRVQERQLIEQYLDVHVDPAGGAKYIAPEFSDLQVADTIKAEISLASKVLTEEQLIAYIENHLNRY